MSSCPRCGAELPEETLYCQQCGEAVSQPGDRSVVAEGLVAAKPLSEGVEAAPELPIPENIAAVISYLTPIPAVAFLYLEPFRRNPFVRFHAFQQIFLFAAGVAMAIAAFLLWMVLQLISFMRVLIFPFTGLIALAWFFLWILLVMKAYRHEWFKLPWIGDLAEKRMYR